MPSRNVVKVDVPDSYYHIYARGRGKQTIYHDDEDCRVFLNLLKRHLCSDKVLDNYGVAYVNIRSDIELLCYCLMPNHFHLVVYQNNVNAMSQLMRKVMPSYTRYYNKKYDSSGSLFESTYKASRISNDTYLLHISRYVHRNPKKWREYKYSSLFAYREAGCADWLQPQKILDLFDSRQKYMEFMNDYESYKKSLDTISFELASK